jgi:HK97 family phage prohead protease
MPLPEPHAGETQDEFIGRCMSELKDEFPDDQQRLAVCFKQWRGDGQNARRGPDLERRAYPCAELRVAREGPLRLVGHAAVFDRLSDELFGFRERVARGAFRDTLDRDVRALWNHDPNHVLGRTRSGTLRLAEDDVGLAVEILLPPTRTAEDLAALVDRGDVSQMSFAFRTLDEAWAVEGSTPVRTLVRVELWDVSPVTFPAYPDTDVALRNLEAWRQAASASPAPWRLRLRRRRLDLL